jgi:predicted dehydrogenase
MEGIKTHRVGIIMNGVTGRMGANQHLLRSIVGIIKQGGVKIGDNEVIMPDPVLVGRNPLKLQELTARSGITKTAADLDRVLADPSYSVYFDSQTTERRTAAVKQAIAAGKHVYCEKPIALTSREALELYQLAKAAGIKNGVVQDKLWLPSFLKLKMLIDSGFFGEILSVHGEFGYWVFEGDLVPAQRPSWNYRQENGGGMVLDMFPHWRYVLDNLFGEVKAVSCLTRTHIKKRWDENGRPYQGSADDAAYATFELAGGLIASFNSSWTVRVRRDDLLTIQVDGAKGSAVAGLREVYLQSAAMTPKPIWNPDEANPIDFYGSWTRMPDRTNYDNAFKAQWELFLRHVVKDEPFCWSLLEGAKGVQLAELAYESHRTRAWVEVPPLK